MSSGHMPAARQPRWAQLTRRCRVANGADGLRSHGVSNRLLRTGGRRRRRRRRGLVLLLLLVGSSVAVAGGGHAGDARGDAGEGAARPAGQR